MGKEFQLDKVRNIGIMAHIDAGKTTTSERILLYSGKLYKIGEVHDGAATMDWMVQEQERGITITSAATSTEWKGYRINLIDTPGHVDFTVEVERSLRILDGAVALFCAKGGVEPQSETVWRQATKYKVPRIAFVNKMDITGANYEHAIEMMRDRLHTNAIPIAIPIGKEETFIGLIDLIEFNAHIYDKDDAGREFSIKEIPSDYLEKAKEAREKLIEALAECDDNIMEKFFAGEQFKPEELKKVLRKAVLDMKITPVLCGSAYKNKGVQALLDAVIDYLPAPTDVPEVEGTDVEGNGHYTRPHSDDAPLSALVFKIAVDPFVGKLSFCRVYSGILKAGETVLNSTKRKKERIGRLVRMHSNSRTEIEEAHAGDIIAIIGLKETTTADTLCDIKDPIVLESMEFPEPVIKVAIEPKTKAAQEKMGIALQKLAEEDPTFRAYTDQETGQTIIAGMGELHLDIIVDRLFREFKVEANVGAPQVAYRETVKKEVEQQGKFVRQSGGKGQYGDCKIVLSPAKPGDGITITDKTVGGSIPKDYIPAVMAGIKEAALGGILAGYELVDFHVDIVDGSYHEVDSSEMAFKIAGSMALKEAAKKANPVILEPIMDVEVTTPDDYLGDAMGTLNSRRGLIKNIDNNNGIQIVRAEVPLSEMFGYATSLRAVTQGRGNFMMQFDHYSEVPANISEKIIGDRSKSK